MTKRVIIERLNNLMDSVEEFIAKEEYDDDLKTYEEIVAIYHNGITNLLNELKAKQPLDN